MFDPQAILDASMKRMSNADKASVLREMLETVATFIDHHEIIVPDISIKFAGGDISLSAKKIGNNNNNNNNNNPIKPTNP